MSDCLFCQIIEGQIPCSKIYEDEDVLAFLDISQTTVGHTLVIPKKHYSNFLATPKKIMNQCMNVAQTIGQAQIQELRAKGVNILTNCYKEAGQSIMHFHIHVVPRYFEGDGFRLEMHEHDHLTDLSLPAIASQIRKGL